uniref:Uncharacterized protein n=1 Tax=Oryza sativa subsp. japonica TaxID=39947 RepID=Q6K8G3_ORYSJ|nr:hypothetical protein [Oryza sativa Japonica Group]BAD36067.1 hypothetical protein [Oryza sativa Japonica Group]
MTTVFGWYGDRWYQGICEIEVKEMETGIFIQVRAPYLTGLTSSSRGSSADKQAPWISDTRGGERCRQAGPNRQRLKGPGPTWTGTTRVVHLRSTGPTAQIGLPANRTARGAAVGLGRSQPEFSF